MHTPFIVEQVKVVVIVPFLFEQLKVVVIVMQRKMSLGILFLELTQGWQTLEDKFDLTKGGKP